MSCFYLRWKLKLSPKLLILLIIGWLIQVSILSSFIGKSEDNVANFTSLLIEFIILYSTKTYFIFYLTIPKFIIDYVKIYRHDDWISSPKRIPFKPIQAQTANDLSEFGGNFPLSVLNNWRCTLLWFK